MKVRARNLKDKRHKNSSNPWHRVRLMDTDEANRAKSVILAILKAHKDGLSYHDNSPVGAILNKVNRRSDFGDKQRQLLIFKSIMDQLFKQGIISSDSVLHRITYNPDAMVK